MGNKFVREGSAKSFLEIYNELDDIEEAWRQKCESAGWTSRMDEDPRHQTGHASLSRPNGLQRFTSCAEGSARASSSPA